MGTEDTDKNDQTLTLPKPSRYVIEFNIYVAWLKVEVWRNRVYNTVTPGTLKSIFHVPRGHVPVTGKSTGCIVRVHR